MQAQQFATFLQLCVMNLPRLDGNPAGAFILQPGKIGAKGCELVLRWFQPGETAPYDLGLLRALTVNAVAKLQHQTKAVTGLEWALGVPQTPSA